METSANGIIAAERKRTDATSLADEFYCRPRRRRLTVDKCLEDYMNANAFGTKRAACWRCPQGHNIRRQFAGER
ncbi:MAG TPA: hypothetical protein DCQ06_14540 [Myxococcales bacterium]|nr:hypothetical protein [Myxococcales bacterium]|tara:strand:- start:817 stop:1038 length:222 start_codon:yes stop_codon:yes gene_type:complete